MGKANKGTAIPLRLEVDNVRAVKKADIAIEGLTVLCGINGTGKSTLAQILKDGIEANLLFGGKHRAAILEKFFNDAQLSLLAVLLSAFGGGMGRSLLENEPKKGQTYTVEAAIRVVEHVKDTLDMLFNRLQTSKARARDLVRLMKIAALRMAADDDSPESLAQAISEIADKVITRLKKTRDERLTPVLYAEAGMHSSVLWEGRAVFSEVGEPVLAYEENRVSEVSRFASVQDVIYIECPLVNRLDIDAGGNLLFMARDADPLVLHQRPTAGRVAKAIVAAFNGIVEGKIVHDDTGIDSDRWLYLRNDGRKFPLSDVATGIKSFSLLSRLYACGCLNQDTVLVIDEPEAHLHPQWIAEYAKMLVLLVADAGVRVLVASHSPDMVNALQAFARSCRLEKRTHFYQAVPADKKTPFMFKFMDRGMDVGEIFDSFNKVYDAIMEASETKSGAK